MIKEGNHERCTYYVKAADNVSPINGSNMLHEISSVSQFINTIMTLKHTNAHYSYDIFCAGDGLTILFWSTYRKATQCLKKKDVHNFEAYEELKLINLDSIVVFML